MPFNQANMNELSEKSVVFDINLQTYKISWFSECVILFTSLVYPSNETCVVSTKCSKVDYYDYKGLILYAFISNIRLQKWLKNRETFIKLYISTYLEVSNF